MCLISRCTSVDCHLATPQHKGIPFANVFIAIDAALCPKAYHFIELRLNFIKPSLLVAR